MSDIFLVTGATGNVGKAVAESLVAMGCNVRGLTRDKSRAALLPEGVSPVIGDLSDVASLSKAIQGTTSIFMLPGLGDEAKFLKLARQAGVQHIMLLSGGVAATGDRSNPITATLIEAEDAVRDSGLHWTILRPGAFMTNTLGWSGQLKHGDVVRAPFAHLEQAVIDPADIARTAATIMREPQEHDRKIYELTGQERLSNADRVKIMSEVLGRPLTYVPLTVDEAKVAMSKTMPEAHVKAFFQFHGDGDVYEPELSSNVETITGQKPRLFQEWVETYKQNFTKAQTQ